MSCPAETYDDQRRDAVIDEVLAAIAAMDTAAWCSHPNARMQSYTTTERMVIVARIEAMKSKHHLVGA